MSTKRPKHLLIELPTADEIDDLAITTPQLEVRRFEIDLSKTKADLNYAPCKGQIILVIRGQGGISFVKRGDRGWMLPSDRIGPTEDVCKSARRIAKQQCGIGLRSAELAGIYDVIWHYSDISVKRLHFVFASLTDDDACNAPKDAGISEARFFKEIPRGVDRDDIQKSALADCSAK